MFDIESYSSFILAIIVFQLFPGAGTIAILTATAAGGVRSGICAVYGTLLGDAIYMSSAVLGLATMLQKYPMTLKVAQYGGVIYLCYLGVQKLVESVETISIKHREKRDNAHVFKKAFAICLTNPKAIMFFMAFFPLFLSQDSRPATLLIMMLHVTVISLIYQMLLVVMGNSVSQYLTRWKYSKLVATRLAGIAFIAFGLKLARNIK